jgi:hypothetical protein
MKINWRTLVSGLIAGTALVIFGVELHRHWSKDYPEDIESLSTLALALLTVVLAYFNWRLARDTSAALTLARNEFELAQEQAHVAKEQFEREWKPDLKIAGFRNSQPTPTFSLANLGRSAALVKRVQIGTGSGTTAAPQDVVPYSMYCLVQAGAICETNSVAENLRRYAESHIPNGSSIGTWQAAMNVSLMYDSAGKIDLETPWFPCTVTFMYQRVPNGLAFSRTDVVER